MAAPAGNALLWSAARPSDPMRAARAPSWPAHIPWLPLGNSASEQAQQLYRRLRQADGMGLAALIVVPPGDRGMGHALRDRLWRAAGGGAVLA